MKELYYRELKDKDKKIIDKGCTACIDLLYNKMKLKKWQCYLVVKTLYDSFPREYLRTE